MTDPISLETILAEFDETTEAWVLQDRNTKKYVTIPHPSYPGRNPIHFFMSKGDAERVLAELLDVHWHLRNRNIVPVCVTLLTAIEGISSDKIARNADGFVLHSPNEVYEFIRDRNP